MATAKESDIAAAFLKELGAPNTIVMRLAVVAWLRMESGSTIIGNNPWNIRPNAGDADLRNGTRISINGNGAFSTYPDVLTGARAAARMLVRAGHDWRHYDRIVSAARANHPIEFLNALAASAWDAGRYGTKNGGPNKLLAVYARMGGATGSVNLTDPIGGTGATIGAGASGVVGKLTDPKFINIPEGKTITAQDVDYIMSRYAAAGFFNNDPAGVAQSITRTILNGAIGKPWTKATRDGLQSQLLSAAKNAVPTVPLDALGSIGSTLIQLTGAILDPANWVRILALLAGLAMTAYGGANVLRAAS